MYAIGAIGIGALRHLKVGVQSLVGEILESDGI